MCYTRVKHHLNASIVERIHHTGKYCDERFLCYNGDMSINFLSIFPELYCFAYAQIHVRVACLFFSFLLSVYHEFNPGKYEEIFISRTIKNKGQFGKRMIIRVLGALPTITTNRCLNLCLCVWASEPIRFNNVIYIVS